MSFDRYLGIPYLDRGRDFAGCDCWGLVHLVYLRELGLEPPSFDEFYVTAEDRHAMAALIAGSMTIGARWMRRRRSRSTPS